MNHKNRGENLTVLYSLLQGAFWMAFAALLGFSSVYLLDAGFSNTQIGLLIAASGVISAVLQPALASYADRPDSPSLKKVVLVIGVMEIVLAFCLLLSHHRSMWMTGLFYGCAVMFLQVLTPLVNALSMECINQGKKINFGIARGIGSATYAVIAYVLGIIVGRLGAFSVIASVLVAVVLFAAGVILFPFQKSERSGDGDGAAKGRSPVEFFHRYKKFCVFLAGCILVYISHVLLNNFTFQIVESKGGGSAQMGISMALSALIELPPLFLFTRMLKKVRCDIWIRIAGVFFMLKALGTLLAPSVPSFYAVQILQLLGWAVMAGASVYYVNSIMEEQDAIKGQAYMTMTYTLGSVTASLLGGVLIDRAGVNAMLIFASSMAFIGMVLMLLFAEKTDENGK